MRFLLVLLLGCSAVRDLDSAEKNKFEGSWWEVHCGYNECPMCFKINQDHTIETYDLDLDIKSTYGTWSFEEPNIYYWDLDEEEYKIKVTPSGDCWDLKYSIFKLEACRCSVELPV